LLLLLQSLLGRATVDRSDHVSDVGTQIPVKVLCGIHDDDLAPDPTKPNRQSGRGWRLGVLHAAMPIFQLGDHAAKGLEKRLRRRIVGQRPSQGAREHRVPVDVYDLEVGVEVLEDVPGNRHVCKSEGLVCGRERVRSAPI
jgi:hypothetical protein